MLTIEQASPQLSDLQATCLPQLLSPWLDQVLRSERLFLLTVEGQFSDSNRIFFESRSRDQALRSNASIQSAPFSQGKGGLNPKGCAASSCVKMQQMRLSRHKVLGTTDGIVPKTVRP